MTDQAQEGSTSAKTPTDFLNSIKGKAVIVKLNSGVHYRGMGCCYIKSINPWSLFAF